MDYYEYVSKSYGGRSVPESGCCLLCSDSEDGCMCFECNCTKCSKYDGRDSNQKCQKVYELKSNRLELKAENAMRCFINEAYGIRGHDFPIKQGKYTDMWYVSGNCNRCGTSKWLWKNIVDFMPEIICVESEDYDYYLWGLIESGFYEELLEE